MKSAQMFGKIFIYVIALIVMAMIFVYGYTAIKSILEKGEQVLFVQMKTDITSAVEDVSADYGRVDKKKISIPGNYNVVYFIDLKNIDDKDTKNICISTTEDYNPIICDAWKSVDPNKESESPNMFLVHGTSIKSLYVGDIKIGIGYVKIDAPRGEIILRLEGVANGRVLLDKWS